MLENVKKLLFSMLLHALAWAYIRSAVLSYTGLFLRLCFDIVFCLPSIYVLDPKKSKKFIFSPWGFENIQNDVAQPVRTPKRPK